MNRSNLRSGCKASLAFLLLCSFAHPAFADYNVTGRFQYEDRVFDSSGFPGTRNLRPIRFADVQILVAGTSTILGTGATNADGTFSISVQGSTQQSIQARCLASSTSRPSAAPPLMEIRSTDSSFNFGGIYSTTSGAVSYRGGPTLPIGDTTASYTSDGRVFNIWDVTSDGMDFVASPNVAGSFPADKLTILWRSGGYTGSFYSYNLDANQKKIRFIHIGGGSGYDDTVIAHQFGHFVADLYSKLDAPATVPLFGNANEDIRVAWAEGLSMFIGASVRKFKGYDHPEVYVVTDGNNLVFSISIDTLTSASTPIVTGGGSTNLFAVCAALWNITNGTLQRPFPDVWKVLTVYFPTVTAAGITVEDFWDGWFSPAINNGSASEMRTIFSNFAIEFAADTQEPDDSVASAPTVVVASLSLASGPKVVINEVSLGNLVYLGSGVYRLPPVIELYNAGDAEADLTGWTVTASRANTVPAVLEMPSFKLKPGAFVYLTEGSNAASRSAVFFSAPIPWMNGFDGACALRDNTGLGKDFVRWGDSKEFPPGIPFSGSNPPSPQPGKTLGRNYAGANTNSGADWTVQGPSVGTFNTSGQGKHHTYYPAGDVDYVAFNATAGRTYVLETLNLTCAADTILELLSPDGSTVLANNDDHGRTRASRIVWSAPGTGKYILRARRFDGATNYAQYGAYDLQIIESTSPLPPERPDILKVTRSGQAGTYQSISEAVAAAGHGDTIQIMDSESYQETLAITDKSLTLKAAGGKRPVLDGRGSSASATISLTDVKAITLQGFTILGGIRGIVVNSGSVKVINMIVNKASGKSYSDGIAISGPASNASIVNCTVVNNGQAGVAVYGQASANVVNSIVRSNSVLDVGGDAQKKWTLVVKNSNVPKSDFVGKDGNINTDPKFVNAGADDYHLPKDSPCIDKGDPNDPDLPSVDADGIPRSLDGNGDGTAVPDMGAFEYLPAGILTSTAVFPQIAVGGPSDGEYRTAIYGMNTGPQAVIANVSLTKSDGNSLPVTVPNGSGSTFNVVISPGGTLRLETSGTSSTVAGYAKFSSSLAIGGSALFKILNGNRIISEAGVGLSKPTRNFTVYIDNLNSAFSGYAIANYGPNPANLTLILRDKNGAQVDTTSFSIPAGQHVPEFAVQRFQNTAPAGFEGTIEFTSTQDVAAVALRYDNSSPPYVISTIPVLVDEAATTLYFPQVADGGGYRTNFILVNPGASSTTARLEFFDDNGAPLSLPIKGVSASTYDVTVGAKGVARFITDGTSSGTRIGWVRVTSSLPLGGSSIFQTLAGARITSQAGVASSPLATHFTTYVESSASPFTGSGLAIANPNNREATVTLNLRDSEGTVVANTSLNLPAQGHVAKFFSGKGQWFPGFDQFEGTLEVVASAPVSGVALRYDNDRDQVFATLPVVVIP